MNAIRTFLFSSAFATAAASLLVTSFAIAATDPAKGKAAGAADENAIIKLTPKQKLPKRIKQLTIIEHDEGDKSAAAATSENAVLVHYSGWLYDATKPDGKGDLFESTGKGKLPFGFFLGAGKVIKGWERGIVGMKPKGKRTLIIPPALGYGETARPKIPANSTLVFDIELVDILGARDKPAGAGGAANSATTSTTTQATPPPIVPPPAILPPVFIAAKDTLPVAPTQLTIIEHAVGEGAAAENGNTVAVHYTGWLYEPSQPGGKGKKFDSSVDRNQTFKFPLGGGRVIKGWDQGVLGMKAKGKRTLIIPAELGYGARSVGNGLIPANSTLIFDVELIEIPPA
jgi:peptidylprolyl isomerase